MLPKYFLIAAPSAFRSRELTKNAFLSRNAAPQPHQPLHMDTARELPAHYREVLMSCPSNAQALSYQNSNSTSEDATADRRRILSRVTMTRLYSHACATSQRSFS
jgi:hypothetical protein